MKKIGAIILRPDRGAMLVVRKLNREAYIIPGGRPEDGETDLETLARELREELKLELVSAAFFGEYVEPAAFENTLLTMRVYEVEVAGSPVVDNEITEAIWIDGRYADSGIALGSTLARHVVPALIARGDLAS